MSFTITYQEPLGQNRKAVILCDECGTTRRRDCAGFVTVEGYGEEARAAMDEHECETAAVELT